MNDWLSSHSVSIPCTFPGCWKERRGTAKVPLSLLFNIYLGSLKNTGAGWCPKCVARVFCSINTYPTRGSQIKIGTEKESKRVSHHKKVALVILALAFTLALGSVSSLEGASKEKGAKPQNRSGEERFLEYQALRRTASFMTGEYIHLTAQDGGIYCKILLHYEGEEDRWFAAGYSATNDPEDVLKQCGVELKNRFRQKINAQKQLQRMEKEGYVPPQVGESGGESKPDNLPSSHNADARPKSD